MQSFIQFFHLQLPRSCAPLTGPQAGYHFPKHTSLQVECNISNWGNMNFLLLPAIDTKDMFGKRRIATGVFGSRSLALVFNQLYEENPDPGLLGENSWLERNWPRQDWRMSIGRVFSDLLGAVKVDWTTVYRLIRVLWITILINVITNAHHHNIANNNHKNEKSHNK